ncbi:hypothetical protein H072_9663 [Dactylellina haptotyla CBS 200.50]|uniref:Uncharacterized protein n=1 Tax=Dactylellina haptotyla (strain CBS 200.50) TaxID=1284197 RepID=S8A6P8_DACHA|nr:hypothetical protein H072_9663 [Dactylellina haptotyla CBS 200.50]
MPVEVPVNWKIWTKEIDRKSESPAKIWRLIFSLRFQLHIVLNDNNAEIVDWMFGGQYETSYIGKGVWILNPDSVSIRLGALDRIVTTIDGAVIAVNADLNILRKVTSEYPGVSVDSGFIVSQVDGTIKIMTTYINLLDMLRDIMTGVLTEFLLSVED